MKIGIVGYQGSGKSTLFQWLTGVEADPSKAHTGQSAMAAVPDDRVQQLCDVYEPKKITMASLELVDTPGLDRSHEGNAARLGIIREAGCLVIVTAAFSGADPLADLTSLAEDLLLADMEIVSGRIERLRQSVKKPRPDRDQQQAELDALESLLESMEAGTAIQASEMSEELLKATRSFRLLTEKPRLLIVNTADDEADPSRFEKCDDGSAEVVATSIGLEMELSLMSDEDRSEFESELGDRGMDRDDLLRKIMDASGQMIYFTAGEKEVRTWMLRANGTAVEAAGNVHTDLARGFIRAEVMTCDDLFRLGGEREVKAENLMRKEPKDYVVQDGDILHILSNV
jgi:ribosome-binding ATPase YchF (GTP1/OBG family)